MTTMRHLAPVFAIALLGCNPPADIFPEPGDGTTSETSTDGTTAAVPGDVSGSRLRLRQMVAADGYTQTYGAPYDSVLQTVCTFALAVDGATRCLPSASTFVADLYSSADCVTPIVLLSECSAASKYAVAKVAAPKCGQESSRVYPIGSEWGGGVFRKLEDGTCLAYTVPAGSAPHLLDSEMAADAFVSAELLVE